MDYNLKKLYEKIAKGETIPSKVFSLSQVYEMTNAANTDKTLQSTPHSTPNIVQPTPNTGRYTNKSYNEAIAKALGKIPQVAGNYILHTTSNLQLDPADKKVVDDLYNVSDGSKGTGNGEIAIYWLFGKNYFVYDNRGQKDGQGQVTADAPDLRMSETSGGDPTQGLVEIKSYANLNEISLGKFKDDKSNRYLLSILLGVDVLFGATKFNFGKKDRPVTVDVFNSNEILAAFKNFKILHDAFVVNQSVFANFPANNFLRQITDQLDHLAGEIIPDYQTGSIKQTEAELTNLLLQEFALSKLRKKPGMNGGCIINISKKNDHKIEIIQTKANYNSSFNFFENVASSSGELKIKNLLNLFPQEKKV